MLPLPEFAEADYTGSRKWEDVRGHVPAAVAVVRDVMGFNVPEGEAQVAAFKAAVNAALDVDAAYGFSEGVGEGGGSMRLGSFSISGQADGAGGASQYDVDMLRAVRRALSGTGLLYQGLG